MDSVSSRINVCHEKQVPKSSGIYNLSPPQFGVFAINRAQLPSWCFLLPTSSQCSRWAGVQQQDGIRAEGAADTWVWGARGWFLLPELAVEQIPSCLTKLMNLKWGFGTFLCSHEKGAGRGLLSVFFTKQMITPQNDEWYNYKSNCRDHCDVLLHYERQVSLGNSAKLVFIIIW